MNAQISYNRTQRVLVFVLALVMAFSITIPAFAQTTDEAPIEEDSTTQSERKTPEERAAEFEAAAAARQAEREATIEARQAEREETQAEREARRTEACEARKAKIADIRDNLVDRGQAFKDKVDSFLARVDAFASENDITSDEITRLRTVIDGEQADVATAVETMRSLRSEIDCSDPDGVSSAVDAYRAAVDAMKIEAHEYVDAIKAYAEAVVSEARAQSESGMTDDSASETDDEEDDQ